ncbi:hypothetical protein U14_00931 [Candidatus Moduliflexus flocculans]|uniref:Uncharacterized protein n=1 Tax=Candidatus Moduliflexus flocculans TaxID=1499966 RepID=A0A0S6VVF3_9BACT|nr:hypothetical protein U14_00931 [Candidatus Moduliflexus flocculans]
MRALICQKTSQVSTTCEVCGDEFSMLASLYPNNCIRFSGLSPWAIMTVPFQGDMAAYLQRTSEKKTFCVTICDVVPLMLNWPVSRMSSADAPTMTVTSPGFRTYCMLSS